MVENGKSRNFSENLRTSVKARFITGFFVTVPVVVTLFVLWKLYDLMDSILSPIFQAILGRQIPGLGFVAFLVLIFLIGSVATNVVGRRVLTWAEDLALRIPIFKRIYPSVKQLVEAFSPQKRGGFQAFVLVEHPRKGEYAYGFLTGRVTVEGEKSRELVSVFIPTNHLYLGDVILVPQDEMIRTGLSIEEGIRIVLSAGTAAPRHITPL